MLHVFYFLTLTSIHIGSVCSSHSMCLLIIKKILEETVPRRGNQAPKGEIKSNLFQSFKYNHFSYLPPCSQDSTLAGWERIISHFHVSLGNFTDSVSFCTRAQAERVLPADKLAFLGNVPISWFSELWLEDRGIGSCDKQYDH